MPKKERAPDEQRVRKVRDDDPDRPESPPSDATRTASSAQRHADAPAIEPDDSHRKRWTDEEKSLYFGAPAETPVNARDAAILGHARKAETYGNNVVNVLSELEFGEIAVSRFERKKGRVIDWGSFFRVPLDERQLRTEREEIEKEAHAIEMPTVIIFDSPEGKLREHQRHLEYVAARRAKLEERRRRLEEKKIALAAEWKEMYALRDLIRDDSKALECPRVRAALHSLRASALLFANKELPSELKELLSRIGKAIAHPRKYTGWKPSVREREVLGLWSSRSLYSHAAFSVAAERLFPSNRKSAARRTAEGGTTSAEAKLEREARRYIARARAKESRIGRGTEPRPVGGG